MSTVALCMLADDSREWLIRKLLPRWSDIDMDGHSAKWVLGLDGASASLVDHFRSTARWPVTTVTPDLRNLSNRRLVRIAALRAAVRRAALEQDATDWFLWIDSDIDPGPMVFKHLVWDLTCTRGPLAPRCAAGYYGLRLQGWPICTPIGLHLDFPGIPANNVAFAGLQNGGVPNAGFGCLLMHRTTLGRIGWDGFDAWASTQPHDQQMDDGYWHLLCRSAWGVPPVLDSRVICKHYHQNGCYWTFAPHPTVANILVPGFITDERDRARDCAVENISKRSVSWSPVPCWIPDVTIEPGGIWRTSPDWADMICRTLGGNVVRRRNSVPTAA